VLEERKRQRAMTAVARREGGQRAGLTRERVAAAGLRIVDREGLDSLTMRRLAEELGVGTMTLYGYFRDKDELLDAVLEVASAEVALPPASGPWRPRLRALMVALHEGLTRHPSAVELRLRRPIVGPQAFRLTEMGLQALMEAGLSRGEAARAFRTLFLYVFSVAAFNPDERGEEARRVGLAAVAALPRGEYPAVTGAASDIAETLSGERQFLHGLDLILDGIESRGGSGRSRGRSGSR
jgi:AcrR family transcriptional regulator